MIRCYDSMELISGFWVDSTACKIWPKNDLDFLEKATHLQRSDVLSSPNMAWVTLKTFAPEKFQNIKKKHLQYPHCWVHKTARKQHLPEIQEYVYVTHCLKFLPLVVSRLGTLDFQTARRPVGNINPMQPWSQSGHSKTQKIPIHTVDGSEIQLYTQLILRISPCFIGFHIWQVLQDICRISSINMTGEGLDPPATTSTLFDVSLPRPFDDHNQEIPAMVFKGCPIMILSNKNRWTWKPGRWYRIYVYIYINKNKNTHAHIHNIHTVSVILEIIEYLCMQWYKFTFYVYIYFWNPTMLRQLFWFVCLVPILRYK